MSPAIRDFLALIGLACVLCTPVVVALLAMAGRRREEDDGPGAFVPWGCVWDERRRRFLFADPVRDLAARAKGGDE